MKILFDNGAPKPIAVKRNGRPSKPAVSKLGRDWPVLSAEPSAVHGLKRSGRRAVNGGENLGHVVLDDRPVIGSQSDNRQPPPGQILLIGEGPITCNKDFHPPCLRRSQ